METTVVVAKPVLKPVVRHVHYGHIGSLVRVYYATCMHSLILKFWNVKNQPLILRYYLVGAQQIDQNKFAQAALATS